MTRRTVWLAVVGAMVLACGLCGCPGEPAKIGGAGKAEATSRPTSGPEPATAPAPVTRPAPTTKKAPTTKPAPRTRPAPKTRPAPATKPAPVTRPAAETRPATTRPAVFEEVTIGRAMPTGQRGSSVVYVEQVMPREVIAGRSFECRVTVTNLKDAALDSMSLSLSMPGNFEIVATTPQAAMQGKRASWDMGVFQPREAKAFVVKARAVVVGEVSCQADLVFRNLTLTQPVRVVQPALKIVKAAPDEVLLGETIVWKIVVTNSGTGKLHRVVVKDDLPVGMTSLDGRQSVTFDLGDMEAGQSRELTLPAKVARAGKYVGKASAVTAEGMTAVSAEVATMVRQPVLAFEQTAPPTLLLGQALAYAMTVTNNGDGEARGVVVTATIPAGVKLQGVSAPGQVSGDSVTWSLGVLRPGASAKAALTVLPGAPGPVRSAALMKAVNCADLAAKAETVVKGIPAVRLDCAQTQDPLPLGVQVVVLITISNQGTAGAGNLVVRCMAPENVAVVAAGGPTSESVKAQAIAYAPLASLAPGERKTYKVTVTGLKGGPATFKVSVGGEGMVAAIEKEHVTRVEGPQTQSRPSTQATTQGGK